MVPVGWTTYDSFRRALAVRAPGTAAKGTREWEELEEWEREVWADVETEAQGR